MSVMQKDCPEENMQVINPPIAQSLFPRVNAAQDSSTCSDDSWHRGNGQRVVAFTFFGDPHLVRHNTTYFEGILANVDAISSFYNSNWSIRLYHDIAPDDPWSVELCKIACSHDQLDLCRVNKLSLPIVNELSLPMFNNVNNLSVPIFSNAAVDIFPMLWTLLLRCILLQSPQNNFSSELWVLVFKIGNQKQ